MIIINYRKATIEDLNNISILVTNLLGTCNISKDSKQQVNKQDIINDNKEEIKTDINNYYVCEINNHIVGAIKDKIIYEAWGDKEYVNSKYLLEKYGFELLKDLGDTYYKDNGYCNYIMDKK